MLAKSVLIIDDEKEVIEVLSLYLQKEGFSVKGAFDGEEGLLLISQEHFELLENEIPGIEYTLEENVYGKGITSRFWYIY